MKIRIARKEPHERLKELLGVKPVSVLYTDNFVEIDLGKNVKTLPVSLTVIQDKFKDFDVEVIE